MLRGNLIKIALIDDDEDDFLIIAEYIKSIKANLHVEWIPDYDTALTRINERAYNIYFADYRLGKKTGLELLQEASANGCREPIVILTGKGDRNIDIQAMQSGATDYLVKSELNTEKLERCIRYALERAQAFRDLLDRENKYRNLFEGSKDAIFIADEEGYFKELNQSASQLFRGKRGNLVGVNLYHFLSNPEKESQLKRLISKKQPVYDLELEIFNDADELIPCLLSLSFFETPTEKTLVHGILHDITNIRKAELANLQAQKLSANERLMRTLAHEIRNPLNNISLSIDHFESTLENAPEFQDLFEIMKRNCTRINHILTELIDITRPPELAFQVHSLQEILDESIMITSDRIGLQKIEVRKSYPETPFYISANKSKLVLAFTNILINAVEAMELNKGQLVISLHAANDGYEVFIQDNGKGIPEEFRSKLFEPFFTLKKNGVGLGLATSYSIFQSHKAQVRIESEVNKGTCFIMRFKKSIPEAVSEQVA